MVCKNGEGVGTRRVLGSYFGVRVLFWGFSKHWMGKSKWDVDGVSFGNLDGDKLLVVDM